jgi:hypothetical protein
MPSDKAEKPDLATTVGLCARCRYALAKSGAQGSTFWRCSLADTNSEMTRYPRLPVLGCRGFHES